MKRFTRNATLAGVVAVAVSLVTPLSAAASQSVFPNPSPNSNTILNSQLPNCSGITGTKAADMAGQGWVGDWQIPMQIGTRTAWATLSLPCWTSGAGGPAVYPMMYVINATGTFLTVNPLSRIMYITYTCNGVRQSLPSMPVNGNNSGIPTAPNSWIQLQNPIFPTFCTGATDVLSQIDVGWSAYFNNGLVLGTAQWRPALWGDGTPKTIPANVGQIPFPGGAIETPVVCNYALDTTDILTTTATFFTAIGPWFTCLWIPAGWDRSGQIPSSYEQSGISRTDDILTAVIPGAGSVVCGTILDLNAGPFQAQWSSCPMSNAVPAWIKIGIGAVTIVGMLFLFIRRVQWAVVK